MSVSDVAIVGGGLIGLATAWRLAGRGAAVTVLDAGLPGQASAAAAGMLAPLAETEARRPLVDLGIESLRRYPKFLEELSEATGGAVSLSGPGMLRLALTEEDEERLCRAFAWQKALGLPLDWLDGETARGLEPWLAASVRAAVLSPWERHISPRPLHAALLTVCERVGVAVRPEAALGFETAAGRVTGIRSANGVVPCGQVVIAAGAWSGSLAAALGVPCPLAAVKGQILALGPRLPLPIRHTLYAPGGYIVPRQDGRVVVGATEEEAGFDTATTADGIGSLLRFAIALTPQSGVLPLDSVWTGLRPVSPDGCPLLGAAAGWGNVSLATGHGRNGVLLTPITAELIAAHVLSGTALPREFAPERFGVAT